MTHIAIFLACMSLFMPAKLDAQNIEGIWGHRVSTNRGELYWFMEGINERELLYDDGTREMPHYVSVEVEKPRAAVKFDSLDIPIFIKSIQVFVNDYDYDPDQPGDQYSPFYLGLYDDDGGHPGDLLNGPFLVQAEGNWSGGGEWVKAETGYILFHDDVCWNVFIWMDEHRAAPTFGLDMANNSRKSMQGYYADGWVWQFWKTGDFMFRAKVIENDRNGVFSIDNGVIMPDSFRVYAAGHGDVYPAEIFYHTTIYGKLHGRVSLHSPMNYFCVTAFIDNNESPPSKTVMIEGSDDHHADVDFRPERFEICMQSDADTSLELIIHNENGSELNYRFFDVYCDYLKPGGPVSLAIWPEEGSICDGCSEVIHFEISTGGSFCSDCLIEMQVAFWDIIYGYADEGVRIYVEYDELTAVDDEYEDHSAKVWLGQNFPNPFHSETVIPYDLGDNSGDCYIEIYNLLGEKVFWQDLEAGVGRFIWYCRNQRGEPVSSGIYLYRLVADSIMSAKKMLFLK